MIGKVAAACAALLVLAPQAVHGQGNSASRAGPMLHDADYPGVIGLAIDARDVSRAILRGTMTLPVAASGPMTIYFPRWVPGHHAPSGPIARIAGLTVRAGGAEIGWRRDPVMMHAIHVVVPEGADKIEVGFQYLSPTDPKMGRIEVSPEMIDLQWTSLAPYPAGYASRRMTVQASVRLPESWTFATALATDDVVDGVVRFKPVDYETLVDSPILAGRYSARHMLDDSAGAPVTLAVFADRPELLAAAPAQIEAHRRLVDQSLKLFASRHYDRYDFLVGLTSKIGGLGAEHSRSSENFTVPDYFTDWAGTAPSRELLPHEFVHSWNGKFRRGADLLTPTLDTPMQNSLLWVYEGLTRYLGAVLSVRSGLHSLQEGLDNFALTAATMQNRAGRQWRPLLDTTNHSIYAEGPQPWPNWQRGSDYYLEGQLIWLDVDTRIRALSGGKRSLDDFVRAFFSIENGSYRPVSYVFDDVVTALSAVAPWDWARYFRDHVEKVAADAPLDGLARGGYRLVYTDAPTGFFRSGEAQRGVTDLSWSIGLTADKGGMVTDVIDQGTTSSRAIVFDVDMKVRGVGQKEFRQHFPASGWVEHDPEEIWSTVLETCRKALSAADVTASDIAAIGITNQRETVVVWDKVTGKPIHNAIVWQDRRTAPLCAKLRKQGLEAKFTRKTGLLLDPYFSGTKIAWLLGKVKGARRRAENGELLVGTIDSFLIWRLTGGKVHATDATNASRTLIYNIATNRWDAELLNILRIPEAMLPEVKDCAADYGRTERSLFGAEIPILGVAGDQQAATIGQACFKPGMMKSTYGTGCFALLNTGPDMVRSKNRLLTTIAYRLNGKTTYALEGSIFIAGAAVQWLRDGLRVIGRADQTGEMAALADPSQDVYLVPAFVGLGAPHWHADARGAMFGLTRNTGPAEFARAALEAVAYQTRDLLDAMRKDWKGGTAKTVLRVDGGMVASDWTMQCLADILDAAVDRPTILETTALGAAWLAGSRAGVWPKAPEFSRKWALDQRFQPAMDDKTRSRKLKGWRDAVRRTLSAV